MMYGINNNYNSRSGRIASFRGIARKVIKQYVKLYKREDSIQDLHDRAFDAYHDAMTSHR